MPDLKTVYLKRPSMATIFELWLTGDSSDHLEAAGYAALDEITRIEKLFNRYDPASELSRINLFAAGAPVKTDVETFAVLKDCLRWYSRTDGGFDISLNTGNMPLDEGLFLEEKGRFVGFGSEELLLDLGGYAKGYALDKAAAILSELGVNNYFMHGGTSSALARGEKQGTLSREIALTNPFDIYDEEIWQKIPLENQGFSCSTYGDICYFVTGSNALIPEIISTALAYNQTQHQGWQESLSAEYQLTVRFLQHPQTTPEIRKFP